ncbi:MAG: sulfite oxidase heme-binding subunit YedZ [Gammaproteobacteria bacterium]
MQRWQLGLAKAAVWVACLIPFAQLFARAFGYGPTLGADPVAEVLHSLGITGLNLLLITLAITPARLLTGFNVLVRFRRLLGLFSFFYICLHFAVYVSLDLQFAWNTIGEEIVLRPFITIGMIALLLMIPLAVTSTRGMQRRLGRRWAKLHRLVYPIAILGVWHFWWQVKADIREPALYAAILAFLLGYRVWRSWQRRRLRRQAAG